MPGEWGGFIIGDQVARAGRSLKWLVVDLDLKHHGRLVVARKAQNGHVWERTYHHTALVLLQPPRLQV